MAVSQFPVYFPYVDPDALKLAKEIEASRQEIDKLQERVRQLVARRGKRAELVKSTQMLSATELPEPETVGPGAPIPRSVADDDLGKELSPEEGLAALKSTSMSEIRLIAFKHGAVIFLFANEKTLTVRMDDRGPKPLLDLLTSNESNSSLSKTISPPTDKDKRPRP
jgi:hypothetical protein